MNWSGNPLYIGRAALLCSALLYGAVGSAGQDRTLARIRRCDWVAWHFAGCWRPEGVCGTKVSYGGFVHTVLTSGVNERANTKEWLVLYKTHYYVVSWILNE